MKKQIIILIVLILAVKINYGQDWQWVKHIGSNYPLYGERPNSIISDGTNLYIIGSYGGTLFLPGDTLYCHGNNDIFIAKFDINGNQLWAKTLGGNYTQPDAFEDASGVFDPINNCIFIGGTFINSINFGNDITLSSPYNNKQEIFVARMDLNGNFIWAKQGGSSGIDNRTYTFVEPDGDVLLAGKLENAGNIDTTNIPAGGFLARFDCNGILKWAEHKFSGPENYKISISFIGTDLIMGGLYRQNPSFIDTVTLMPLNSSDGYITRMDSLGRIKWIKDIKGDSSDAVLGISIDSMSNIYITGYFQDSISINGTIMVNDARDLLLVKLNANGNLIWARQAFAENFVMGSSIKSNSNGDNYIIGQYGGSALFGSYNISTTNAYDMFLTRFNNTGTCLGITHFGQASGSCLALNNAGNAICAGVFLNTVKIGDSTLTSYGQQDIYIARSDAITGIEERKAATNNQLLIYANPTTGKCTVSVPDDFLNAKNLMLSIFDSNGKLIQQKKLEMNEGRIKLDLEAEAKGIYNVTLSDGKRVYGGRIVFQ